MQSRRSPSPRKSGWKAFIVIEKIRDVRSIDAFETRLAFKASLKFLQNAASFFANRVGHNRHQSNGRLSPSRQDHLITSLGTADEVGEARFCFGYGKLHRHSPNGPFTWTISPKKSTGHAHKTIHHPLPPGLLKINLKLVALDLRDLAVAEFLMEYALAHRQIAAAFIA